MMDEDLSPDARRQKVVETLAAGILRLHTAHALARVAGPPPPESPEKALELPPQQRTHVTAS